MASSHIIVLIAPQQAVAIKTITIFSIQQIDWLTVTILIKRKTIQITWPGVSKLRIFQASRMHDGNEVLGDMVNYEY